MAPSLSLSLIILALSFWTSTNLLPIPPPSVPSPLPPVVDQIPELQNASKEVYKEYNISKEPDPSSLSISKEPPGNFSFFLDNPVIQNTTSPLRPKGETVSSLSPTLIEDNQNSSSVLYENDFSSDFSKEGVNIKPLCDNKKHNCETESKSDLLVESTTKLTSPVSDSTTGLSGDNNREIIKVNISDHQNTNKGRKSNTNFTEYVYPTSISSTANILHRTQLMNKTRPSTISSTNLNTTASQTTLNPTTILTTTFKTTLTTSTKTTPATTTTLPLHTTRKSVSRSSKVKGHATKVKGKAGGGGGKKKNGGKSKSSSVSSVPTHHLAKHFTGFVQHVWLPNSTPRPPGPIDDGPFGSILWRDKKYLVSVLIPIGVGFAGAMMIIVMAYASRAWRKRKERLAHAQGLPGSFLEAATSKNDDTAPLHESSDDEF